MKPAKLIFAPVWGLSYRMFLAARTVNRGTFFSSCPPVAAGFYRSGVNNADSRVGAQGNWHLCSDKTGRKKKVSKKAIEQFAATAKALENIHGALRSVGGCEEEIESALQQIDVIIDSRLVEKTLGMYANNWKLAFGFFNWAARQSGYQHTAEDLNAMINILGKAKQFDVAWEVIEKMNKAGRESSMVTHKTFGIMFKRYAAAHMPKEAIEAFHRMEDFDLEADRAAFHSLLNALCEHNHVAAAEHLSLVKESEFPPDTKTFNILLSGWCKVRAWSECKRFWKAINRHDAFHPDIFSYSIYMDALSKAGNPKIALKLYEQMKENGCDLDVTLYNIVLHVLCQAKRVKDALELYHEMLAIGCRPNVMTYNCIIKNLCRVGRVHKAYRFLEQMVHQRCIPNAITYHCFFGILKKPKETLNLYEKMLTNGCAPTLETYVMLIRKFGRWGLLKTVFIFWNQMEQKACSPDECAYNALIDALIKRGRLTLARKYYKEMVARGLSSEPRMKLLTNKSSTGMETENSL